jgi:hypothetical protein
VCVRACVNVCVLCADVNECHWAPYVYVFVVCECTRSLLLGLSDALPFHLTDALSYPRTNTSTQTRERIREKLLEHVPSRNPEWPLTGHILDPVSIF